MAWMKQGLVFAPQGQHWWNKSHAAVPVVDQISEEIWRIYYSSRDEANRSHISYIDVEAGNPRNVLYEHSEPILKLGELGTFDECGLMPSWVVNVGGLKYLYYVGWTVRNTVPYHNAIGLAISEDGGQTFERFSAGPLFDSTYREPYFTATSCVLVENGVWKNWYLSCVKWEVVNGKPEPFYHLKYAESEDGVNWRRNGDVAIDFKSPTEAGIVKASVLREPDAYRMWYSYRNLVGYRESRRESYRIGYAESFDGKRWKRMDDSAGIDISEEGWDSEMIEYPHVINHEKKYYLFYNGNGFGKTGFGYAISKQL